MIVYFALWYSLFGGVWYLGLIVGAVTASATPPPPTNWTATVGAAVVSSPVFQGAREHGVSLVPDLRLRYRDKFFASIPEGVGYSFGEGQGLRYGPLMKIRFSRDEETGGSPFLIAGDSKALRGLGDVGTAGELGGFVQYTVGAIRNRAEVRRGFGGHQGLVVDLVSRYEGRAGPLQWGIGPRLTYAGSDFTDTYFGIDSVQSERSGLAQYSAGAGVVSVGLGGSLLMPLSQAISLSLIVALDRLGSDVAGSPLIRERGEELQALGIIGLGYRFGWD